MRHRSRPVRTLIALAAAVAAGAPAQASGGGAEDDGAEVSVTLTGLRNHKGNVLACMTRQPRAFPDCSKDPASLRRTVAATQAAHIAFGRVPRGTWAISLVHDENANNRLDTALGIPREGYGFSRDAAVRFGPPSFKSAAVTVGGQAQTLPIRMRYIF